MKLQPVHLRYQVVGHCLMEALGSEGSSEPTGYRQIIKLVPREAAALERALAESQKRVDKRFGL